MQKNTDEITLLVEAFESNGGYLPWPKKVMAVLLRDKFVCYYCNDTKLEMTADHKLPKSRGGTDDLPNLVCACADCNRAKGAKTVSEFLELTV